LKCAACGAPIQRDENPHAPFCSRRCQELDLGRWLKEEYGMPWEDSSKPPEPDEDDDDRQV
jgi:endogenous inhibitor of DNA gyrase (YacG/DUF329 family)